MKSDDVVMTSFGDDEYWVAWTEEDNPGWTVYSPDLRYRVFRDEIRATGAVPITEAMSREEAERKLYEIQLLIGGTR